MTTAAGQWSVERQRRLREQLQGYWAQETWDLRCCPLLEPGEALNGGARYLRFTCRSPGLNTELQYALWRTVATRAWRVQQLALQSRTLRYLIEWLNQVAAETPSLLERPLAWWELSFRTYLGARGVLQPRAYTTIDRTQALRTYAGDDRRLGVLRRIYRLVAAAYDERPEQEKDRWDLRTLGKVDNATQSHYWLDFTGIGQPWLRETAKRFTRHWLSNHSAAHCRNILFAVRLLSEFLDRTTPPVGPADLSRALLVDFIASLPGHLHVKTRWHRLASLKTFLEVCAREGWGGVPEKPLLYDDDLPKGLRSEPRYLPEAVVEQLNRHVDALPEPLMRMVLVLQECGMRISELCSMPFDCLHRDGDGDWWLRYYQGKQTKEHSIPLLPETVAVLREQQAFVRQAYGSTPFLFPNARTPQQPTKQQHFARRLNRLAYEREIRDESGARFRFESHQFRHTVGTRMINRGYPQHIVQRFLGHETPAMTSVYAHLHDATLKRAFQKFARGQVDVTGRAGQLDTLAYDLADLQWFKRNLHAQALPHGTCWLPATKGQCPHANACFTCAPWRTDLRYLPVLQQQLGETRGIIDKAKSNGWARQVEMNEQVERNLVRVIATLEDLRKDEE